MIRLSKPDIRDGDIARAVEVLRSGMLVQGENVEAFERALERFSGLPHAVAVSSGTAALHLALRALGIGPGDAVLVPAFTFPATANVVEAVGAETVLCDVDPRAYVVTPDAVAAGLAGPASRRLKAVMVVHEFGYPAQIEAIAGLCRQQGLLLIEDAACALGTVAGGRHPGSFGDAACLSFHPRKAITTGEGGAVLTRRPEVAERIACLRNHGIVRTEAGQDFAEAGLNYRLTDFQAALALGQLERFGVELVRRRSLAEIYQEELREVAGLTLPELPAGHSLQSFMVVLAAGIIRARVMEAMLDSGIQTNLGAQALNGLTYFRNKYGVSGETFSSATRLYQSGLVLPLYGALTAEEVRVIAGQLRRVLKGQGA
jgi:perosamine synthetase